MAIKKKRKNLKNYSQILNFKIFEKDQFVDNLKGEGKKEKKMEKKGKKFKALKKHLSFAVEIPAGLQRDATKRSEIITQ